MKKLSLANPNIFSDMFISGFKSFKTSVTPKELASWKRSPADVRDIPFEYDMILSCWFKDEVYDLLKDYKKYGVTSTPLKYEKTLIKDDGVMTSLSYIASHCHHLYRVGDEDLRAAAGADLRKDPWLKRMTVKDLEIASMDLRVSNLNTMVERIATLCEVAKPYYELDYEKFPELEDIDLPLLLKMCV